MATGKTWAAKAHENELALDIIGGIEWVAENVAMGHSLRDVARKAGVSYFWLYNWIAAAPQRARVVAAARRAAAGVKMAEAEDIVDELTGRILLSPADVAAAKLRAETRAKMAARLDPEQWDEKKPGANTLNINELHLHAVEAVNASPPQRALAPVPVEDAEYEIVPGQETGTTQPQVQSGQEVSE